MLKDGDATPAEATLHYPGGLSDFLNTALDGRRTISVTPFAGDVEVSGNQGLVEWAVTWPDDRDDGFLHAYCNTIPTPQGGTHEAGLRTALLRGIKAYGELVGNKKVAGHRRRHHGWCLQHAVGLYPGATIPGPDQG